MILFFTHPRKFALQRRPKKGAARQTDISAQQQPGSVTQGHGCRQSGPPVAPRWRSLAICPPAPACPHLAQPRGTRGVRDRLQVWRRRQAAGGAEDPTGSGRGGDGRGPWVCRGACGRGAVSSYIVLYVIFFDIMLLVGTENLGGIPSFFLAVEFQENLCGDQHLLPLCHPQENKTYITASCPERPSPCLAQLKPPQL